ncbi:MAG: hypothetical protein HY866_17045 [Chloroflexi bacterium]|nr:hypothetical protein [Chloroflexota bacterium]
MCKLFNYLSDTFIVYDIRGVGITGLPNPGETFTISVIPLTDHPTTVSLVSNISDSPVVAGPALAPVTLSYTVPESGVPAGSGGMGYYIVSGSQSQITIRTSCTVIVPGCDVTMPLPSTAVVGAFVADAPIYWAPGKLTSPLITMASGKTAYVIGLDASGEYYKIMWVCQFLWVRANTMGPNYDAVWQGKALPVESVN